MFQERMCANDVCEQKSRPSNFSTSNLCCNAISCAMLDNYTSGTNDRMLPISSTWSNSIRIRTFVSDLQTLVFTASLAWINASMPATDEPQS